MEALLKDDDVEKEFEAEWEDNFIKQLEKVENDFYSTSEKYDDEELPELEHHAILSKCFGHKRFRPMQWKIIKSILKERRDNCAIMTTGYGKSLCYQYPSAYMGGLTLVISPLISLMEDQVLAMQVANISACLLGSANTKQKKTIEDIFEGKYSLVYLTPEFCTGDYGKELLSKIYVELSVVLIAVDEAHCVSTWGHDFRFQYRQLGILKEIMPDVPILAVTATATPKVKDDIIKILKLKKPQVLCSGFDRPNLFFSVNLKSGNIVADTQKCMQRECGEWKFSGPTIIYCITRKETEDISDILSGIGIKCLPYHAGLSLTMRKDAHEKFLKDKVEVIIATIAFGMGIDKPDIRNIIHYGSSNSIEAYYQEVGRAGRDGLPAKCVTFYSNYDFEIYRRLREDTGGNKKNKEQMADLMLDYLRTRECRRQFILSHFEGAKVSVSRHSADNCCDNCTRKMVQPDSETYEGLDENGKYDFTEDALILLNTVAALNGKYGIQTYVLFLRGSRSSKMASYLKNNLHGSGKHKSDSWWKGIGALMEKEKYLEKIYKKGGSFSYFVINISQKGYKFLEDSKKGAKLLASPTPELFACLKTKPNTWLQSGAANNSQQPSTSTSGIFSEEKKENPNMKLYQLLMNKRYELATSQDCMPYLIASNKALTDMATYKPITLQQLRDCQLDGFTEAKITKFGEEFLKTVRSHLNLDSDGGVKSIQDILVQHPYSGAKISISAQATYSLFRSGLSIQEIAQKRGVIAATIMSHLIDSMKLGYPIKLIDLEITNEIKETIISAIKKVDTGLSLLTPIKNACPPDITYNQVKAVVTFLQIREHIKNLNISYEEFEDEKCDMITSISDVRKSSHSDTSEHLTLLNIPSIASNRDTKNPPRTDSPGQLTQLVRAMEECEKNPTNVECLTNEDSNFSEGIADADLAAVCEELETSIHEIDNDSGSTCELPPTKRYKTEETDVYSILDSPPRKILFQTQVKTDNDNNVTKCENTNVNMISSSQPSSKTFSNSSKKNKLNLPPWLTVKRIA